MTVAQIEDPPGGALAALPESVSVVVERYAADLAHCKSFAEAIVETPFVPAAFWPAPVIEQGNSVVTLKASGRDGWDFRRRHPREDDQQWGWRRANAVATTAAVIYSGAVLGLNWQAAVSGIYVANGRASLYAEQMRALILAAGHRLDIEEMSDERCALLVQRVGESVPTPIVFTMDQAVRAGYVQGKGPNTGSDSWKGNARYNTNSAEMLLARATTLAGKAKFADVVRGMVAREVIFDEPVDITATTEVTQPAQAQLAQVSTAEILAGRPAPEPEPEAVQPAMITDLQWRAINALFVDLGVTGIGQAAARLHVISALVERTIAKGSELTNAEARLVRDNLSHEVLRQHLAGTEWAALLRAPEAPADAPAEAPDAEEAAAQAAAEQAAEQAAGDTLAELAQAAAEQAQADSIDPTVGPDPWAHIPEGDTRE